MINHFFQWYLNTYLNLLKKYLNNSTQVLNKNEFNSRSKHRIECCGISLKPTYLWEVLLVLKYFIWNIRTFYFYVNLLQNVFCIK